MNNKKYYPFERNNYFYGKLIGVKDFEDEQRYFNDKRRLNNYLLNGVGVVSGLHTMLINDTTISIDAGLALDSMGREIVIDDSMTKKLSVIEGFQNIDENGTIYLCLEYKETKTDNVYNVIDTDSKNEEFTRIKEGYTLFLTNDTPKGGLRFFGKTKETVFTAEGICVSLIVPKFINSGCEGNLELIIESKGGISFIDIEMKLAADHISDSYTKGNVLIHFRNEEPLQYGETIISHAVSAENISDTDTVLSSFETCRITIDNTVYDGKEVKIPIRITKQDIAKSVIKDSFSRHFDEVLYNVYDSCICLASMRVHKKKDSFIIDNFIENPFDMYVLSNQFIYSLLSGLKDSTKTERPPLGTEPVIVKEPTPIAPPAAEKLSTSGQEDIHIDLRAKGKTFFTDEIAHGFSDAEVCVLVSVCDISDNYLNIGDVSVTGDRSALLGTSHDIGLPKYSTAVINYKARGTFRIALKLLEDYDKNTITIEWTAFKTGEKSRAGLTEQDAVEIVIEPNTKKVAPREKFKFAAIITGTSSKECKWSVTEEDGGQIDLNGVYEAPNKEGVYEIRVKSVKYPQQQATAFVVVQS